MKSFEYFWNQAYDQDLTIAFNTFFLTVVEKPFFMVGQTCLTVRQAFGGAITS